MTPVNPTPTFIPALAGIVVLSLFAAAGALLNAAYNVGAVS